MLVVLHSFLANFFFSYQTHAFLALLKKYTAPGQPKQTLNTALH